MLARTHLALGLLAGVLVAKYYGISMPVVVLVSMISSILPDIDHKSSLITRILVLPRLLPLKHRGMLHSLAVPIIGFIVLYRLGTAYAIAFFIGYLSHLVGDAVTKEGVNFLYPLQLRIAGPVRTGGMLETVVFIGVLVGIVLVVY